MCGGFVVALEMVKRGLLAEKRFFVTVVDSNKKWLYGGAQSTRLC